MMKVKLKKESLEKLKVVAEEEGVEVFVAGGLIVRNHKLLMLKRSANEHFLPGLIEIPSGKVDMGESILNGLSREVKEETGLDITSVDSYFDFFDYLSSSSKKSRQFNFVVTVNEGEIILNPREHCEYIWIDVNSELDIKLNISEKTRILVKNFLIKVN